MSGGQDENYSAGYGCAQNLSLEDPRYAAFLQRSTRFCFTVHTCVRVLKSLITCHVSCCPPDHKAPPLPCPIARAEQANLKLRDRNTVAYNDKTRSKMFPPFSPSLHDRSRPSAQETSTKLHTWREMPPATMGYFSAASCRPGSLDSSAF